MKEASDNILDELHPYGLLSEDETKLNDLSVCQIHIEEIKQTRYPIESYFYNMLYSVPPYIVLHFITDYFPVPKFVNCGFQMANIGMINYFFEHEVDFASYKPLK